MESSQLNCREGGHCNIDLPNHNLILFPFIPSPSAKMAFYKVMSSSYNINYNNNHNFAFKEQVIFSVLTGTSV